MNSLDNAQLVEALLEARDLIRKIYQSQHPEERAWFEFEKNDRQMHIINMAILSARQISQATQSEETHS